MTKKKNLEESLSQQVQLCAAKQAIDETGVDQVLTDNGKDPPSQDAFEDEVPNDGPQPKPCTDLGNAERLVERFGREMHYCQETNLWYVYRRGRWIKGSKGTIFRMAYKVVRSIADEAKDDHLTADQAADLKIHAKKSASKGRIRAMLDLTKWFPGVCVSVGEMDADPWLLNCLNGTLDLRTGQLRAHDSNDLITKMLPVNYDKDATCPGWQATIDRIMGGDEEKIGFLKRVFGYALPGVTSEQCMFVLYGSGANGKSTILEIFRELLAGYAMHTTTASLLGSNGSPIRNDLARLNGSRFVSAVEVGMGKKLDEALVKQLTGGDQVTARFLYNEFFEYKPQFKLFIAANHKPEIKGVDHGIWRRIHLIPFDVTIPPEEIDRDLPNTLQAELAGILAWAVQGCLQWQVQGLNVPESIKNATARYRAEMDVVAEFINDCCRLTADNKTALAALYDVYKKWADDACQDVLGKKTFGNLMRQKGFIQSKSGGVRFWNGIELIEQ
ncbi:DNA primase family protein [Desulfatitalea tepidiphila]|uniref:DNA primase family protein n=1 Tax=Desulfatitalea tepidiphila TaxID=1185843 RepID=UPI0006B67F7A|nr:phage/plasmid primase, P4 family [Desulfatitalea tepidiphila]